VRTSPFANSISSRWSRSSYAADLSLAPRNGLRCIVASRDLPQQAMKMTRVAATLP
jgi:hypothetical protein